MQDHPLTPMQDPDLRRVLSAQSRLPVGHVDARSVMTGAAAIRAALPATGHVIVDAIRDADLMEIGKAAKGLSLLCGGSGIALGLPANFGNAPAQPGWEPVTGPGAVLSGSCSRATRGQVEAYKAIAPHREITAADAVHGRVTAAKLADWALAQGTAPLIYSSADPETVKSAQQEFGAKRAAEAIETLFSDLAALLAAKGAARIVVAGGETSGAAVKGLKAQELQIGPRLAAGVPALRLPGPRPLALALKSGNFGRPGFFAEALAAMEQTA
jgi:uncharacterized protein YgbK (DUF1537 family)